MMEALKKYDVTLDVKREQEGAFNDVLDLVSRILPKWTKDQLQAKVRTNHLQLTLLIA